jgi:hypothetical protein
MIFRPQQVRGFYASYFEDESGPIKLSRPGGSITEDELFIRLRGLRGDFMQPGESRMVPYVPSLFATRLSHHGLGWTFAVVSRDAASHSVSVPAGTFDCMRYDVGVDGGRSGQFFIEAAYPHRIIKWSLPPDVNGELTGSTRLPYWKLNQEGDESYLNEIGLGQ